MKKIIFTLTAAMFFAWQGMSFADTAVDQLIQKLKDKGILTDQDADQLKSQITTDQQAQQTTFKSMLPDWIQNIKLTGDMRLRYQYQRREDRTYKDNIYDRGRVRARLQFEDQVNDKVKVIFGIATDGSGNSASTGNFARSNNISFGGNVGSSSGGTANAFGKDNVVINKAYAKYTPNSDTTLMIGKMDNPIWEPQTSFLWDGNITPEGGALQIQKKINDLFTPWATGAVYDLDKVTPSTDNTWMGAAQVGAKGNLSDKVYYKAAGLYYSIQNPTHQLFDPTQRSFDYTNTEVLPGSSSPTACSAGSMSCYYKYNYTSIYGGTAELGMNDPLGETLDDINIPYVHLYLPQAGVFGSYIQNNSAPSGDNAAWQIGGYMGNSALNGWGTWRIISAYKVIERDAWMDIFPDYDFYTGDTDVAGWRNELDLGLMKNVYMGLNFYDTRIYKPFVNNAAPSTSAGQGKSSEYSTNTPAREALIQADINIIF